MILAAGQAVTEDELIEFCRQALPSFKRPRKVVFVGGYPTTATGKIRRVELRRMAATVLVPGTPAVAETVVAETVVAEAVPGQAAPGGAVVGETVLGETAAGRTVLPGEDG